MTERNKFKIIAEIAASFATVAETKGTDERDLATVVAENAYGLIFDKVSIHKIAAIEAGRMALLTATENAHLGIEDVDTHVATAAYEAMVSADKNPSRQKLEVLIAEARATHWKLGRDEEEPLELKLADALEFALDTIDDLITR